jgi:hypothetical protein
MTSEGFGEGSEVDVAADDEGEERWWSKQAKHR